MRIQHNLKSVPYQAPQLRPEAAPLPLNITPEMIASAIEARAIVPVFQPVVDMKTGETVSCEVLSRWNHDDHGVIVPGAFIACAEAAGWPDRYSVPDALRDYCMMGASSRGMGLGATVTGAGGL